MEEEEEPKEFQISGKESDAQEVDSGVNKIVGSLHQEDVNSTSGIGVEQDDKIGLQGQGVEAVTTVTNEEQFEHVSLDQDTNNEYVDSKRYSDSEPLGCLSGAHLIEHE